MSRAKLSISNLAWTKDEDEDIFSVLREHNVEHIDLAMGRYFAKPHEASVDDWIGVKKFWESKGISIAGMQSLLFGVPPVSLFGNEGDRRIIRSVLDQVFARANAIGVRRLVLGSPAHRLVPPQLDNYSELAANFFGEVAQSAQNHDVVILIEPNSKRFNCNFLNNAKEAAAFVSNIPGAGIGVNLDLGAEMDDGGDLSFSTREIATFGHLHLSEPDLGPIGKNQLIAKMASDHQLLRNFEYLTIEQLGSNDSSNLLSVSTSLGYARENLSS
jgi:sugar phosphate isomerase/epimerase